MIMTNGKKHNIWRKVIAVGVVCLFLANQLAWAHPDALATQGLSDENTRRELWEAITSRAQSDELQDNPLERIYREYEEAKKRGLPFNKIRAVEPAIIERVVTLLMQELGQAHNCDVAMKIGQRLQALADRNVPDAKNLIVSGINLIEDPEFTIPHAGRAINIPYRKGMTDLEIANTLLHEAISGCIFGDSRIVHGFASDVVALVNSGDLQEAAARLSRIIQSPFPQLTGQSNVTLNDIGDVSRNKYSVRLLLQDGPIRVPPFYALVDSALDEVNMGNRNLQYGGPANEFINPKDVRSFEEVIESFLKRRLGPGIVYKPNRAAIADGQIYLEHNQAGVLDVTINYFRTRLGNRMVSYLEARNAVDDESVDHDIHAQAITLKLDPKKQDVPDILRGLWMIITSNPVYRGKYDAGMFESKLQCIRTEDDRAYSTRCELKGSLTSGKIIDLCRSEWGGARGAPGKVVSNVGGRAPAGAKGLESEEIFRPLYGRYVPEGKEKDFEDYVAELIGKEFEYICDRFKAAGIFMDGEVTFYLDLVWLPPEKEGDFPVPAIVDILGFGFETNLPIRMVGLSERISGLNRPLLADRALWEMSEDERLELGDLRDFARAQRKDDRADEEHEDDEIIKACIAVLSGPENLATRQSSAGVIDKLSKITNRRPTHAVYIAQELATLAASESGTLAAPEGTTVAGRCSEVASAIGGVVQDRFNKAITFHRGGVEYLRIRPDNYLYNLRGLHSGVTKDPDKTSFYRHTEERSGVIKEEEEFCAFIDALAEKALRGEDVRILSAGCSTGEEAYTIAFELLKRDVPIEKIHIVGVSENRENVADAEAGLYYRPLVEMTVPEAVRQEYFHETEKKHWLSVNGDVRDRVKFRTCDLTDTEEVAKLGKFDGIVYMRAYMYVPAEERIGALENLTGASRDDTLLLTTYAENSQSLFVRDETSPTDFKAYAARQAQPSTADGVREIAFAESAQRKILAIGNPRGLHEPIIDPAIEEAFEQGDAVVLKRDNEDYAEIVKYLFEFFERNPELSQLRAVVDDLLSHETGKSTLEPHYDGKPLRIAILDKDGDPICMAPRRLLNPVQQEILRKAGKEEAPVLGHSSDRGPTVAYTLDDKKTARLLIFEILCYMGVDAEIAVQVYERLVTARGFRVELNKTITSAIAGQVASLLQPTGKRSGSYLHDLGPERETAFAQQGGDSSGEGGAPARGYPAGWVHPSLSGTIEQLRRSSPDAIQRFEAIQEVAYQNWQRLLQNRTEPLHIAVVVPAYAGEAERIRTQDSIALKLYELDQLIRQDKKGLVRVTLYIVDDGSAEGLEAVVGEQITKAQFDSDRIDWEFLRVQDAIGREPCIAGLRSPDDGVKWPAVKVGAAAAMRKFAKLKGAKLVCMNDIDSSQRLTELPNLFVPILEEGCAAVNGARFIEGAAAGTLTIHNYLEFYLFTPLVQACMPEIGPVQDLLSGLKVFTADALGEVIGDIRTYQFSTDVEAMLLIVRNGGRISEVPRSSLEQTPELTSVSSDRHMRSIGKDVATQIGFHKPDMQLSEGTQRLVATLQQAIATLDMEVIVLRQGRLAVAIADIQAGRKNNAEARRDVRDIIPAAALETPQTMAQQGGATGQLNAQSLLARVSADGSIMECFYGENWEELKPHVLGVARAALLIARRIGVPTEGQLSIVQGALLHDTGFIGMVISERWHDIAKREEYRCNKPLYEFRDDSEAFYKKYRCQELEALVKRHGGSIRNVRESELAPIVHVVVAEKAWEWCQRDGVSLEGVADNKERLAEVLDQEFNHAEYSFRIANNAADRDLARIGLSRHSLPNILPLARYHSFPSRMPADTLDDIGLWTQIVFAADMVDAISRKQREKQYGWTCSIELTHRRLILRAGQGEMSQPVLAATEGLILERDPEMISVICDAREIDTLPQKDLDYIHKCIIDRIVTVKAAPPETVAKEGPRSPDEVLSLVEWVSPEEALNQVQRLVTLAPRINRIGIRCPSDKTGTDSFPWDNIEVYSQQGGWRDDFNPDYLVSHAEPDSRWAVLQKGDEILLVAERRTVPELRYTGATYPWYHTSHFLRHLIDSRGYRHITVGGQACSEELFVRSVGSAIFAYFNPILERLGQNWEDAASRGVWPGFLQSMEEEIASFDTGIQRFAEQVDSQWAHSEKWQSYQMYFHYEIRHRLQLIYATVVSLREGVGFWSPALTPTLIEIVDLKLRELSSLVAQLENSGTAIPEVETRLSNEKYARLLQIQDSHWAYFKPLGACEQLFVWPKPTGVFEPSPMKTVAELLEEAGVNEESSICDFGVGLGHVCVVGVGVNKAKMAAGSDIDDRLVDEGQAWLDRLVVTQPQLIGQGQVSLAKGNYRSTELTGFTHLYAYPAAEQGRRELDEWIIGQDIAAGTSFVVYSDAKVRNEEDVRALWPKLAADTRWSFRVVADLNGIIFERIQKPSVIPGRRQIAMTQPPKPDGPAGRETTLSTVVTADGQRVGPIHLGNPDEVHGPLDTRLETYHADGTAIRLKEGSREAELVRDFFSFNNLPILEQQFGDLISDSTEKEHILHPVDKVPQISIVQADEIHKVRVGDLKGNQELYATLTEEYNLKDDAEICILGHASDWGIHIADSGDPEENARRIIFELLRFMGVKRETAEVAYASLYSKGGLREELQSHILTALNRQLLAVTTEVPYPGELTGEILHVRKSGLLARLDRREAAMAKAGESPLKPEEVIFYYKRKGESIDKRKRNSIWTHLPSELSNFSVLTPIREQTEGLVVLTCNPLLIDRMRGETMLPSETYEVVVNGKVRSVDLESMRAGVLAKVGRRRKTHDYVVRRIQPERLEVLEGNEGKTHLRVSFAQRSEGGVAALFEKFDYSVESVTKVAINGLELSDVAPGGYRHVGWDEIFVITQAFLEEPLPVPTAVGKEYRSIPDEIEDSSIIEYLLSDESVIRDALNNIFKRFDLRAEDIRGEDVYYYREGRFKRVYKVTIRTAQTNERFSFLVKVVMPDVVKSDSGYRYNAAYATKITEIVRKARQHDLSLYSPVGGCYVVKDGKGRDRILFVEGIVPATSAALTPHRRDRLLIITYLMYYRILKVFFEDPKPGNAVINRRRSRAFKGTVVDNDNIRYDRLDPYYVVNNLVLHGYGAEDIVDAIVEVFGSQKAHEFLASAGFPAEAHYTIKKVIDEFRKRKETLRTESQPPMSVRQPMRIVINGKDTLVPAGTTLLEVLDDCYVNLQTTVVTLNGKPEWWGEKAPPSFKSRRLQYQKEVLKEDTEIAFYPGDKKVEAAVREKTPRISGMPGKKLKVRLIKALSLDVLVNDLLDRTIGFAQSVTPPVVSKDADIGRVRSFNHAIGSLINDMRAYLKKRQDLPFSGLEPEIILRRFSRVDFRKDEQRLAMREQLQALLEEASVLRGEFVRVAEMSVEETRDALDNVDTRSHLGEEDHADGSPAVFANLTGEYQTLAEIKGDLDLKDETLERDLAILVQAEVVQREGSVARLKNDRFKISDEVAWDESRSGLIREYLNYLFAKTRGNVQRYTRGDGRKALVEALNRNFVWTKLITDRRREVNPIYDGDARATSDILDLIEPGTEYTVYVNMRKLAKISNAQEAAKIRKELEEWARRLRIKRGVSINIADAEKDTDPTYKFKCEKRGEKIGETSISLEAHPTSLDRTNAIFNLGIAASTVPQDLEELKEKLKLKDKRIRALLELVNEQYASLDLKPVRSELIRIDTMTPQRITEILHTNPITIVLPPVEKPDDLDREFELYLQAQFLNKHA